MTESAYNRANDHMRAGAQAMQAAEYERAARSYGQAARCFEEDHNKMTGVALTKRAAAERLAARGEG